MAAHAVEHKEEVVTDVSPPTAKGLQARQSEYIEYISLLALFSGEDVWRMGSIDVHRGPDLWKGFRPSIPGAALLRTPPTSLALPMRCCRSKSLPRSRAAA